MSFPSVPIGAVFAIKNGATPASAEGGYWDGDIPWVTPADLGALADRFISSGTRDITIDGYENCGTQMVPAGSIVLSIRAPIGHMAISRQAMCFNQGCRGLVPSSRIRTDFAYWALVAAKPELEAAGQGTTFIELGRSKLRTVKLPLPDLDTQKAIARYLDRETARIDQLIAKKERFQEVIDAKRKALTAGVVDGSLIYGSNSEGDVGWFGRLPAHWKVRRARLLFRERIDPSQDGSEELLTVSHITGVTARADKDVSMFLAETLEGYKLVQPNDLVVNTMWAWMGAVGVSPITGCTSPSYAVYRPHKEVFRSDYLDLVVRSLPFVAEVNRRSKGVWASRLRLYPDAFLDISFPVPPLDEQAQLVGALNTRMRREELIATKADMSIALLRERRAALITAAVAGQIDIRHSAAAIATKADRAKFRLIVGAEIVHRHQNTKRFGRIKNQKLLFLAEAHAGISELAGNYIRFAAGPYDAGLIDETERAMEAASYFRAQPPNGDSKGVSYIALQKAGQHATELKALLGNRADGLRKLIELLHDSETENVEAVATLYAVWNDALMDGESFDDARIIRGVLTEWDPEKQKFKPEQLQHWLDWMKRHGLTPRGQGPRTAHTMTRNMFS